MYLSPQLIGFPWNFVMVMGLTNRMMSQPDCEKVLTICAFVKDTILALDRETDGEQKWS